MYVCVEGVGGKENTTLCSKSTVELNRCWWHRGRAGEYEQDYSGV